jgi:uncharacterized membrane protein YdbT with pleckstrin-like domain
LELQHKRCTPAASRLPAAIAAGPRQWNIGDGRIIAMQLMFVYAVTLVVAEAVAVALGEIVELYYPSASLIVFMALFLAMLWVAWIIALRLTNPRGA